VRHRHNRPRVAVLVAGLTVAGLLGCGGSADQATMTSDLERDLELAANARPPQLAVVSAIEGGPRNAPSGAERGKRDAVPTPRRMPRPAPQAPVQDVAVTPELEEAAAPAVTVAEQVEPTPAPVPEPAVQAPEPEPEPGPAARGPSAGTGEAEGRGEAGRGQGRRGGGWGTLIGVIIRGGAAGIDNCEEHDRRRGRGNGRNGNGGYGGGVIVVAGPGGWGGPIRQGGGGTMVNGGTPRTTYPRY
jgi:hypothetical protein